MLEAIASDTGYPAVPVATPFIHVLLHHPQETAVLYSWFQGRLEQVNASNNALAAWVLVANEWGHVQQPVRASTPAGAGWLAAFPGPQVGMRAVVCRIQDPSSDGVEPDPAALRSELAMAAQLAQARHQLQAATTELNHNANELRLSRQLGAMLRQPLPASRLQQELARQLREALGMDVLWIWPETDLRKRPVVDHADRAPDRRESADARRVAETVMAQGECRAVQLAAEYLGAPLILASTVHGAIVGRLPAHQASPRPEQADLLRALAGHVAVGLDYVQLQQSSAPAVPRESGETAGLREAAGSFAHDINNLLGSICLQAEVGADSTDDSELTEHFEAIRSKVLRAAQIVRRLQGLADTSAPPVSGELVDLGELVHDVIERHWPTWRDQAGLAGAQLRLRTEYADDAHVVGSPTELSDLVMKVIRNALEAMPRGGDLEVQLLRDDSSVIVRVRDTGLGMTPEVLEQACEPFFTTKQGDHVGLGLTIARSITAGYRGRLVLASEPGSGTTVEAVLPVARKGVGRPSRERAAAADTQAESLSVLVADDDATFLHSMTVLLRRMGHRVTAACDGREATGLLRGGGPFDILLLDLSMPEMGGWEVARLARQLQPNASILLLTGWGERVATINDGRLDQVLSKPISLEALAEAVTNCEARRRAESAKQ
jgi:signal transduction histidine kinase/CheY-like chemotaxis protein